MPVAVHATDLQCLSVTAKVANGDGVGIVEHGAKVHLAGSVQKLKGYKGHNVGSRKGRIHQAFDEQDAEAAFALGQQLGLKPSTLKTWFNHWRRADKPSQPKQAATPKGKKTGTAKGVKTAKVTKDNRQKVESEQTA